MNKKRIASLAILAATCAFTFGEVAAQSLARDTGPAEQPPASFTGNQYVDSRGCVYIRAGVDGNTNWVPRVSRNRQLVCGLTPSLGGTATAAAPAPAPRSAPAAAPVQIGSNLPVISGDGAAVGGAAVAATQATPTPTITQTRNPLAEVLAPRPVTTVASTPATQVPRAVQSSQVVPATRRVAQAQTYRPQVVQPWPRVPQMQRLAPRAAQVATTVQSPQGLRSSAGCRVTNSISAAFLIDRGAGRRCGPQQLDQVTLVRGAGAQVQPGAVGLSRAQAGFPVGTTAGTFAATPQFSTGASTVPSSNSRAIYRTASGQEIPANAIPRNAIVIPRHVYEQQQAMRVAQPIPQGYRAAWDDDRLNPYRTHQYVSGQNQMAMVWSNTVPRRLVPQTPGQFVTGVSGARSVKLPQNGYYTPATPRAYVSTRNQPAAQIRRPAAVPQQVVRHAPAVQGKRFVQVGTFGNPHNAQRTAQVLQRMGLPVRIGRTARGGRQLQIVMAGPFQSAAHTGGALTAVRNAGYRDAFARN